MKKKLLTLLALLFLFTGMAMAQTTVNGNNVLSASFWISVASLVTSVAVLIVK